MRKLLAAALYASLMLMLAPAALGQQEDLDCNDFALQAEAQAALRASPSGPYGLDDPVGPVGTGEPGVACEGALPGPADFTPVANEGLVPGSGVTGVTATAEQYTPPTGTQATLPDTGGINPVLPILAGGALLLTGLGASKFAAPRR